MLQKRSKMLPRPQTRRRSWNITRSCLRLFPHHVLGSRIRFPWQESDEPTGDRSARRGLQSTTQVNYEKSRRRTSHRPPEQAVDLAVMMALFVGTRSKSGQTGGEEKRNVAPKPEPSCCVSLACLPACLPLGTYLVCTSRAPSLLPPDTPPEDRRFGRVLVGVAFQGRQRRDGRADGDPHRRRDPGSHRSRQQLENRSCLQPCRRGPGEQRADCPPPFEMEALRIFPTPWWLHRPAGRHLG